MVRILVDIANSKVTTDVPDLLLALDEAFAYDVIGREFVDSYKRHFWDGKSHMFSRLTGKFPSGLLTRVIDKIIEFTGKMPVVEYMYAIPVLGEPICESLHGVIPRDYQVDAVAALLKYRRGIIAAATNAGKTEAMADFLRKLNMDAIIMLHRQVLMHQTAERLSNRLQVPVGVVGDGIVKPESITVVMYQSVVEPAVSKDTKGRIKKKKTWRVKDEFKSLLNAPVLCFDECHNVSDDRAKTILKKSNAIYRGAFSGTPLMNDEVTNMQLIGYFGDVLFTISNDELIQRGVSSVPTCRIIRVDTPNILSSKYDIAYSRGIVNSKERNEAIREIASRHASLGESVLIITKEIQHIHNLRQLIPGADYVHGSLDSRQRRDRLEAFRQGNLKTLIASTILDEGVDIANIGVLILAAGGRSGIRLLQRIGRGLRASESMRLVVYDFMDVGNWYLLEHSRIRIGLMKNEGFEVKLA